VRYEISAFYPPYFNMNIVTWTNAGRCVSQFQVTGFDTLSIGLG